MSWLGGSLSSLTGQLSNLTKDILTEGTEEVSGTYCPSSVIRNYLTAVDNRKIDITVSLTRTGHQYLLFFLI